MNKNLLIYVDLGGSKISVIAGRIKDDNSLQILGKQEEECNDIKNGIIEKASGVAHRINTLIKYISNAEKLGDITNISLSVNTKGMKIMEYHVTVPISGTTKNTIDRAIKKCRNELNSENRYVFKAIPLYYYVDEKEITNPPENIKGKNLTIDFNIIYGTPDSTESIYKCIERTGLNVDYIHLGIDADATAIIPEKEEQNDGVITISFGATTTTMAYYDEGYLQHLIVLPLGGKNITMDISEIGISYKNAELLKTKVGKAMRNLVKDPQGIRIPALDTTQKPIVITTDFLATIIEARILEILDPILNYIKEIQSPIKNGIIITGGAANMDGLEQLINEKTGLQVRDANLSYWLSEETDTEFYNPKYSQAIGSMLITNELKSQIEEKPNRTTKRTILPKIITKLGEKIGGKIDDLFTYENND